MTLSELIGVPFSKDIEDSFIEYTSLMREKGSFFNIEGDGWYFISDKNNTPIDNIDINDFINFIHSLDKSENDFTLVYKVLDYWNNKGE